MSWIVLRSVTVDFNMVDSSGFLPALDEDVEIGEVVLADDREGTQCLMLVSAWTVMRKGQRLVYLRQPRRPNRAISGS
jgi:hypothetical protein